LHTQFDDFVINKCNNTILIIFVYLYWLLSIGIGIDNTL